MKKKNRKNPPKKARQITCSDVSYSIDDTIILEKLSCAIQHHKTPIVGMIGHNGAGKTTLAKIISKKIKTNGNIHVVGEVGYMKQEREVPDTVTVRSFLFNFVDGEREEYKIIVVLEDLGLKEDVLDRMVGSLSGGQKRKIQFAKLILQDKKILILDEPTNHIDMTTKQRLIDRMLTQSEQLLFLVISHDRDFLNQVAQSILLVADKNAKLYEGSYDDYTQTRAQELDSQFRQYQVFLKKKKKLENRLEVMRKRASATDNPALGRLIQNKQKYMDREIISKPKDKPDDYTGLDLSFSKSESRHSRLLEWTKQDIVQPNSGKTLIEKTSASIYAGEKIVLYGENGSGKTTLIKWILEHKSMDYYSTQLRVGICDQQMSSLPGKMTVRNYIIDIHRLVHIADKYVIPLAKKYNLQDQLSTKLEKLSFGQKVRLWFAALARQNYNLLILDEPTNHLDIPSKESIEQALENYKGAVLLVSHDSYFVRQLMIDTVRTIDDGELVVN